MAVKLLFSTNDRDAAHHALDKAIGKNPMAECREDPNAAEGKFYQVWDGPQEREPDNRPPYDQHPDNPPLNDDAINAIVEKLAAKMGVK
jgi:hypothetical protein